MKTPLEYHQESKRQFAAAMMFFGGTIIFIVAAVNCFYEHSAVACIIGAIVAASCAWCGCVAFGDSCKAHRAWKSCRPSKHDLL